MLRLVYVRRSVKWRVLSAVLHLVVVPPPSFVGYVHTRRLSVRQSSFLLPPLYVSPLFFICAAFGSGQQLRYCPLRGTSVVPPSLQSSQNTTRLSSFFRVESHLCRCLESSFFCICNSLRLFAG